MTIVALEKRIAEAQKKRAGFELDKKKAETAAEAARTEAQAAAEAGNVSGYMTAKAEAEKNEAAAYVADAQLRKTGPGYTPEDVKGAWADYTGEYNAKFSKKLAEYLAARRKLWEDFSALVDLQNEALKRRKFCADLLGFDKEADRELPMNTIPKTNNGLAGLRYKNNISSTHEEAFFMATGEADEDRYSSLFNSVIRNHTPV